MRALTITLASVAAVLLCACSTPRVALEQANHGVKLIAGLENALGEFRRIETSALTARSEALVEQKNALALVERQAKGTRRTRIAAGDTASEAIVEILLVGADQLAAEDAAYTAALAHNQAAVAALLTPLPSTRAATSAAQTSLAQLGQELSGATRRDELLDLITAVKTSVDAAKLNIEKAEADAAAGQLARQPDPL